MLAKRLSLARKIVWATFLVSLPVSSFPYFPASLGGGDASVRPLLVYPLLILVLAVTFPSLWKKPLPRVWLPFFAFVTLAVISSLLPFIRGTISHLKEVSVAPRIIRSLITLALAGAIYLTVSLVPRDKDELRFTLQWFYAGLGVALFWGSLQIVYVLDIIPNWFQIMRGMQHYISDSRLSPDRISGMAFEPSWFADQLAALWLPWILGAVLTNYTVFKWRWRWLTVEKILFLWMGGVLLFTLSRAGLGVAVAVIGAGVLFFRRKPERKRESPARIKWLGQIRETFSNLPDLAQRAITAGGILLIIAALFLAVGTQSNYISRMWAFSPFAEGKSLQKYFRYIGFGPRFIYWETAYRVFTHYPLFGVGLGNFTFHFIDMMPSAHIGYMPELLRRFVPRVGRVITSKNFFAHLLAETGFMGTAVFVTFLIMLAGGAFYLWRSNEKEERYWGTAALIGIVAFLVDTFSYDSFAVPNPWIIFGLITAAAKVFIRPREASEKERTSHLEFANKNLKSLTSSNSVN
ncbi:MAG: O-antigen ligase family protein [Chloroflexota bacterium]|nr:O-antigen ligase family protein [Chloroflexota bacterium]